jgi:NMD protein affecting ribosome stability and mRNA decay
MNYHKIPLEEKKSNLSGKWFGESGDQVLDDTCPKCYHLQCDQMLDRKGKIELYICSDCNHQWQPDIKVEIGHIVKRLEPVVISPDDIELVQQSIEMKLIEIELIKQLIFGL